MTWKIIGYGPKSEILPCVPEFILVQDGDDVQYRSRIGIMQSAPGPHVQLDNPVLYYDGMWVAIEEIGPMLFPLSEEKQWRSRRAQELASAAMSIKGDPHRVLAMVQAAGRLAGFNMPDLMLKLTASRKPNESLEDTFKRVKNEPGKPNA